MAVGLVFSCLFQFCPQEDEREGWRSLRMSHDYSLSGFDKIVLVTSFIGASIFGYALFRGDLVVKYFVQHQSEAKAVGEIVAAKNDVRRRMNQSLTWYKALAYEEVYERDAIFTGADSEMEIKIGDHSRLKLDANSLVVIQTHNNEIVFDLQVGRMSAQSHEKKPLRVALGGKIAEMTSSEGLTEIHVAKNESGDLNITTPSGEVQVEVNGQKSTVKPEESLNIEENLEVEKKSFSVQLTSHKDGEKIWLSPRETVRLGWKSDLPQEQYQLQISKDHDFRSYVLNKKVSGLTDLWKPSDLQGAHYWRIVEPLSFEPLSPTRTLQLESKAPVALLNPPSGLRLYGSEMLYEDELRLITFKWVQKTEDIKYVIQISDVASFSNLLREEMLDQPELQIELHRGEYYWRVRTEGAPTDSLWSSVSRFYVGSEEWPAPRLLSDEGAPLGDAAETEIVSEDIAEVPESERNYGRPEIQNLKIESLLKFSPDVDPRHPASVVTNLLNPPRLSWSVVHGARGYVIEIDHNDKFYSPVIYGPIASNEWVWKDVSPGLHYWRVKAKFSGDVTSDYSQVGRIQVSLPAPEIQPVSFEKLGDLNANQGRLVWRPVPMASGYRVLVGAKEKTVSQEAYEYEIDEGSNYQIQVAALDKLNYVVSEFSAYHIGREEWLARRVPQVISPEDNVTVVTFKGMRGDSQEPSAEQKRSPSSFEAKPLALLFAWGPVEGARSYDIQMAEDQDFKQVIFEKKISGHQYILNSGFEQKSVYWRVRARFDGAISRWSVPRRYQVE